MKKKMNLSNLKVKSFVTNLDSSNPETVKGGGNTTRPITQVNCPLTITCNSGFQFCYTGINGCAGDGPTTAGPGSGNTGWPPSEGCSNNSCAVCYAE